METFPGKKLQEIRESRNISLEEISNKTHIRLEYLEAIEYGEIESLPSLAQYRGFISLYASFLGVELDQLEADHQDEDLAGAPIEDDGEEKPEPERSPGRQSAEKPTGESLRESKEPAQVEDEAKSPEPEPMFDEVDQDDAEGQPETQPASFFAIANKIKQRRELLSLSLDDINEHTFIRMPYLLAIESGDFDKLPSPVQAKGMLTNYANFLNLDTEEILLEFADGLQEKRLMKQQELLTKKKSPAKELSPLQLRLKNFFSLDLLVILILLIAFTTFVVWGVNRILNAGETAPESTAIPEVADMLLATGEPTGGSTASSDLTATVDPDAEGESTEASPLFTQIPGGAPINIVIIPRQRVWVQVTADFEILFAGRLLPGNAYDYSAEETLEILTGNAGALQIYFNDQIIGSPGLDGQVVDILFNENGQILPTPTTTPTITNTPEFTPTPTLTPTSTPEPQDDD
jgi:cytoskeletal protein RodZ